MTRTPKDRDYDDQKDEPTRPLKQDFDPPFSAPSDRKKSSSPDDPSHDEKPDTQEWYDEGDDDAARDNGPGGNRGPNRDHPHRVL